MIVATLRRKHGDCLVTAIARALSIPYERAAEFAGVALDGEGNPVVEDKGLALNHIIPHLWKNGIAAVHIVSSMHPRAAEMADLPSPDAVLSMLAGHTAIVGPVCYCLSATEADHWFAWDGSKIIEDRATQTGPIPLMREYCNQIGPVIEALILVERKPNDTQKKDGRS